MDKEKKLYFGGLVQVHSDKEKYIAIFLDFEFYLVLPVLWIFLCFRKAKKVRRGNNFLRSDMYLYVPF